MRVVYPVTHVAPVPGFLPAQASLAALPALCKSVQLQLEVLCLLACTRNQFIACIKTISLARSWTSVDEVVQSEDFPSWLFNSSCIY